jgi:hypothetical protein
VSSTKESRSKYFRSVVANFLITVLSSRPISARPGSQNSIHLYCSIEDKLIPTHLCQTAWHKGIIEAIEFIIARNIGLHGDRM